MENCEVNPHCLYRDSLTLKVFNSKFDKPAELNQIIWEISKPDATESDFICITLR